MRSRRAEKAERYEAVTQVLLTDVRLGQARSPAARATVSVEGGSLTARDAWSAATLLLATTEGVLAARPS